MTKALVDTHADEFIKRWAGRDGTEKSNFQLFLSELCEMLAVDKPDPASADNENNGYVFERRVDIKHPDGTVTRGFIDLYKRGCFVLEGKQTSQKLDSQRWDKSMLRAHSQADGYIRSLTEDEGKPPFLIVSDVGRSIEIYSEFSRTGSTYTPFPDSSSHRLKLDDLRKQEVRGMLQGIWRDPMSLDPSKIAAKVTRQIANRLAELAKSLESEHGAEVVGTFLMRCLFTMFSEDVGLLPPKSFTKLLDKLQDKPESFAPALQNLWTLMNSGGYDAATMEQVKRFNGGLFADASALDLDKSQIKMLHSAALTDWKYVEPAIFGTLLERALNPKERHKLGAHYTPRAYVERLVMPTVLEPLRQEWKDVQAAATVLEQQGKHDKAIAEIRAYHTRLCGLRILDPACGSGNFLYVTLEHMKRLEGDVLNTLDDMGDTQGMLELEGISVNPQQFLGIEVNPRAASIAEMVLWIGYLQWHFRTHGNIAPAEPILRDFHNIENRDAVLDYDSVETVVDEAGNPVTRWDGHTMKVHAVTGKDVPDETEQVPQLKYLNPRKAEWPEADYIIGNPPFIGAAPMRAALGDGYVETLRKTWKGVPESSDFVMYWWHKAAETVRLGNAHRFGFITTNSLKQTFNRRVVQRQLEDKKPLSLIFAIPDHPWVDGADGADVRIAMTVGIEGLSSGLHKKLTSELAKPGDDREVLFDSQVGIIHADLSIGANLSSASYLSANSLMSHRGCELAGSGFIVTSDEIEELGLTKLKGVNKHIRKYLNGRDISQVSRNVKVIDLFGLEINEVMQQFPSIYQRLLERVKPERDLNKRASRKNNWWLFGETRKEFRKALSGLKRYISTIETSKHRFFVFLDEDTLPDNKLVNITLDDASYFGVLTSRVHLLWSFRIGSRLGVGNDLVYVKTTCFEKFPFPNASEAHKATICNLAEQIDSHRKRQQAEHPKLTLTNMYNVLEKLRHEVPLGTKEKETHQQGLLAILKELHDDLDRAVFNAYGWDDLAEKLVGKPGATTPLPDKSEEQAQAEEELLSRLVALNSERVAEEAKGKIRWLRPEFQSPDAAAEADEAILGDQLQIAAKTRTAEAVGKLVWPKVMQDQVRAVREQLAIAPMPIEGLAGQFKRKPIKGVQPVVDALESLGVVSLEAGLYRLV